MTLGQQLGMKQHDVYHRIDSLVDDPAVRLRSHRLKWRYQRMGRRRPISNPSRPVHLRSKMGLGQIKESTRLECVVKLMRRIKWVLYKFGVRPKYRSIWYSPSLDWMYSFNDEWKKGKA